MRALEGAWVAGAGVAGGGVAGGGVAGGGVVGGPQPLLFWKLLPPLLLKYVPPPVHPRKHVMSPYFTAAQAGH